MRKKELLAIALMTILVLTTGCAKSTTGATDTTTNAVDSTASVTTEATTEAATEEPTTEAATEEVTEEPTEATTEEPTEEETSTAAPGTLTDEQLTNLASDYYAAHHDGARPPHVVIENDDGTVVDIHLFEVNDMPATATWDWYYINRETRKGYDFLGNEVDFSEVMGQNN